MNSVSSALAVNGLSMEALADSWLPLADGMQQFSDWLAAVIPAEPDPVFVAFNTPLDWRFVNYTFHQTQTPIPSATRHWISQPIPWAGQAQAGPTAYLELWRSACSTARN